jgi:hypothetical protein
MFIVEKVWVLSLVMLIDGIEEVKVDYRAQIQKASRRCKKQSQVPCSMDTKSKDSILTL